MLESDLRSYVVESCRLAMPVDATGKGNSGFPAPGIHVDGQPSLQPCPELRQARLFVVAAEPLEGAAIRALLERVGLVSVYAESPTRAIRMLTEKDDIVVWIAGHFDSDSLDLAIEMRT